MPQGKGVKRRPAPANAVHTTQKANRVVEPREEIQDENQLQGNGSSNTDNLQLSDDQLNTLAERIAAAQAIPTATLSLDPPTLDEVHVGTDSVWIVGSSIIKRAFIEARSSVEGANLGLERINVSIWWQGQGGMCWYQLLGKLKLLNKLEDPPKYLVIHCSGSDIGCRPSIELRYHMIGTIRKIHDLFPTTVIILPRLIWRGEKKHEAIEAIRQRLNSKIGTLVKSLNGHYIRYPEKSEDPGGPPTFCYSKVKDWQIDAFGEKCTKKIIKRFKSPSNPIGFVTFKDVSMENSRIIFFKGCCPNTVWDDVQNACIGCETGFFGHNCSDRCQYPFFGDSCDGICTCNKLTCHFSLGCVNSNKTVLPSNKTNADEKEIITNKADFPHKSACRHSFLIIGICFIVFIALNNALWIFRHRLQRHCCERPNVKPEIFYHDVRTRIQEERNYEVVSQSNTFARR